MQKFLAVLIIFFSVAFDTTAQDEFNCISCPPEEAITQANIAQIRHFGLLERATLELVFSAYLDERNYRIFYLSLPPRFASANIVFPMFVRTNERFPDDYIFDMTGLGTEYDFTSVAYSPDVSIAASGNEQGQITFWDIEQQESLQDSDELGLPVTDMVFHPEETWLAAIYDDAQVGIYKLGDEDLQWLISADDAVSISNAVFSVDGDVLAIAVDSMLQVWDSDNLSQLASTSIAGDALYQILAHPEEAETFYTISDKNIREWRWDADTSSLESVSSFDSPFPDDSAVTAATMNHDGSVMLLVLDEQRLVAWDTIENQVIDVPALEKIISNSVRPTYDVAFSPDGIFLAVGTGFGISFFVIA